MRASEDPRPGGDEPMRPAGGSILGTRVARVEDPRLLRGEARFIDDIAPADALHVAFVRSYAAAGEIRSVDTAEARSWPGVVDVVTADDLDTAGPASSELLSHVVHHPLLAARRVHHVGQPIAAVVATSRAAAIDAVDAVAVDLDAHDAVVDLEAAVDGAVLVHPEFGTNVVLDEGADRFTPLDVGRGARTYDGAGDGAGDATDDDTDDDTDDVVVVRARIVNQRMAPVPLEGRVVAAHWDDGRLHVLSCTQNAHATRDALAQVLDLDRDDVRVTAPDVGGGFGAKHGTSPEELLVPWLARRLQRPVRWTETRSENLVGMVHGRAQVQFAELAGRRDGTLTAYRLDVLQDGGAFAGSACVLPYMTRRMAPGCYAIDDVAVRIRSVLTNTSAVGAYRGAGRPEATAAIERMVDLFARAVGIDPVEVRRRNLWRADDFPLRTATGGRYDTGDYHGALDAAVDAAGIDALRAEQRRRIAAGERRVLGIGVSSYVEITNVLRQGEFGAVEITPDGSAVVRTGSSAHGQGHHTAWAMLVSDRTGIPVERIEVRHGDTDEIPWGTGTGGSKSLQIGGVAAAAAADLVVDAARSVAADVLEAALDDVVHDRAAGTFAVAGVPARAISWADVVAAAPDGQLAASTDFTPEGSTFPFGAHVSVVEVDLDTGRVEVVRHVACDDAGTILNPLLVDGQVHGGVAAGISQALYEEVRFDEDGNPQTTTLADYALPAASEFGPIVRVVQETPTPLNPIGAKGIGEAGTIGATPAVHNAVVDALAHLGIEHLDLPLTPERVWRAVLSAGES